MENLGLCGWITFGFIVGLIARAVTPGEQRMGCIATTLLGIAGAFTGGFLGNLLSGGPLFNLRAAGWIGSVIGAVVLLFVAGAMNKNRGNRSLPR